MKYPYLGTTSKGIAGVRKAIIFSESLTWEEAQEYARTVAERLGLRLKDRWDGPDVWNWFATDGKSNFVLSYTDFPCELCLWEDPPVNGPPHDEGVEPMFRLICPDADTTASSHANQ